MWNEEEQKDEGEHVSLCCFSFSTFHRKETER